MGTFRSLMIIFGMLFCVIVLTFAIGMCFSGFRQGFYDFLNVVPKSSIVETSTEDNQEGDSETNEEQGTTINQNNSMDFVTSYKIDIV